MADLVWEVPRIFSGLLMMTLALWVLALDPRSRLMQVFALFMVVRGVVNIILPFTRQAGRGLPTEPLEAANVYYQVAVPFLAVIFALYLLFPPQKAGRWALGAAAILAGLELWYLLDHSIYFGTQGGGRGWLDAVVNLSGPAYMVVGHVLLRGHDVPTARFVAGISYLLFPIFQAMLDLLLASMGLARGWEPRPGQWFNIILRCATMLYVVWIAWFLIRPQTRTRIVWSLGAMAVAAVFAIIPVIISNITGMNAFNPLSLPFNGILTAAMPVAIGWALSQDAFYAKYHTIQMSLGTVAMLFVCVWALIIGALYAAVQDANAAAAIVGTMALALLLFLLLLSAGGTPKAEGDNT